MKYYCSKCKLAVIVLPEKTIKACKCDAPVTAEMSAQPKGTSKIKV
jgi:hypothetical protein